MTDRPKSSPEGAPAGDDGGGKCSTVFTPSGEAKRRPVPPHMLVTVAILQAGSIRCALCQKPLTADQARILEHLVPVKLGGGNTIDNLRWVHRPCADRKTNGTPATSASGDIHKIRKSERLAVKRLPTAEIEVPVVKERWRWKKKIGGGVVRVRTR